MTNLGIFEDIIIKDQTEPNQNIGHNNRTKEYELCQMNQERYNNKLSLRKKKLTDKIAMNRKIDYLNNNHVSKDTDKFHYDIFIIKNESFNELISKIALDYKEEDKIKNLLEKICYILDQRCKNYDTKLMGNIYDFNMNDLLENNWIENLYKLILIYLKNSEIMEIITHILYLSCIFMDYFSSNTSDNNVIYDNNEHLNKCGYFISADKYIDIYNKIFETYLKEKNRNIIYYMIIFIAKIADKEPKNQENLYISGILDYLIDSIDIQNDDLKEYDIKIWCLTKFDLEGKFQINLELSLKIQKIYIELFLNQSKFNLLDGINEEMDENNMFYNFLKLIENTSYCTEVAYVETLLKSNILEFLMDNINNKNPIMIKIILYIFVNLTSAETSLLKRFIDIGLLKFLTNILLDKTLTPGIKENALVPINNLLSEPQLWNKVLFDNGIMKVFCVLLKNKNIEQNIFSEICFGMYNIIPFCDKENIKYIINDYYIIQLICESMKNIISNNKSINPDICLIFLNLILRFVSLDYDDLKETIFFKFGSINGVEILDQIINIFNNTDIDYQTEEIKQDINNILEIAQLIKTQINIL